MKIAKLYMLLAAGVAAMGFAACSNPEEPVVQKPTQFDLNTPPFAEQVYQLTPEGELELTCSQPNYGIGTVVNYSAEMSLTEDFAQSVALSNKNGSSATIVVETVKIAEAICDLLGITDEDTWQPYVNDHVRPVYFRAIASLPGQEEWTKITSNVVVLPKVEFYYALKTPGYIFMTGFPAFNCPCESNRDKLVRLFEPENGIGSQIYSAVIDVPAGDVAFRFYTKLAEKDNDWDAVKDFAIGAGEPDMNDVNVTDKFVDGKYSGEVVVPGLSNWKFTWGGGEITITVDLNKNTIEIVGGSQKPVVTNYVYMCGNMASSDWTEPSEANAAFYENWRLACSDDSGIYTGTFDLANCGADDLYCRFYQALTGWGAAQWASPTGADYPVESGVAYDTAVGEGCFQMVGAKGKKVSISLDTNANKVTFTELAE